jgi:hypothetical protein
MTVAALVVLVLVVLALAVVARRLWRVLRNEEQAEAGGSFGRQFFGRDKSGI